MNPGQTDGREGTERQGAAPAERRHDLDALRAIFLLLGIPYHAALTFRFTPWIANMHDRSRDFAVLADFLHLFRMPGFFMIAGYFAAMLLRRRPPGTFLAGRLHRLVPPFLAGTLLLVPAMHYLLLLERGQGAGAAAARWWEIMVYPGRNPFEHLWFVEVLLYYTLALAGLAALLPRLRTAEWRGEVRLGLVPLLVVAGLALGGWALATLLLERNGHLSSFAVNFLSARYALDYLPWFALGAALQRMPALDRRFARFSWPVLALGVAAGLAAVLLPPRTLPWMLGPVLGGLAALCLTQASLGMLGRLFPGERGWVRHLVEASFVIYLFHEPVIVLATPILDPAPVAIWPKFALLCLIAFGVSLASWELIRRSPALRYLFNGARGRRPG